MTDSPIVYMLQEPTSEKDLSSASKFGKIEFIISAEDKPAINTQQTLDKIFNALENYRSEIDFICHAGGDPLVEFLAGAACVALNFHEITHLIWNRERSPNGTRNGSGFYVPKKIKLT